MSGDSMERVVRVGGSMGLAPRGASMTIEANER